MQVPEEQRTIPFDSLTKMLEISRHMVQSFVRISELEMAEKGSSEVVDNEPIQCIVEGLFLAGMTARTDFAHTKGRERHLLVVFLPPRLTTLFRRA